MSRLFVALGSLPLLGFRLLGEAVRVGRAQGNDIILSLPDVADRHAVIRRAGRAAAVQALGDEVVTVNGRDVKSSRLRPGDLLAIGGYRMRWVDDSADGPPAVAGDTTRRLRPIALPRERPRGEVVVVGGADAGRSATFDVALLIVGRSPDCDLTLSDDSVSWHHAAIESSAGQICVRDLGSSNGTHVGRRRVESVAVEVGDRVQIGETLLEMRPARQGEDKSEVRRGLAELVGDSEAMQAVYERIREDSANRLPVLLLGETGTGKELAARALHSLGPRSGGAFVPVNCAAIPRELIEAELFGYSKGAFTGASVSRRGAFERADGGTLFLDEICELPLALQPKLLRVIEDGAIHKIGGEVSRSRFRLISATNRILDREVSRSRFRDDLYYRIAVSQVVMPPLRERPGDIAALVDAFLETADEQASLPGGGAIRFSESALKALTHYRWPGNVRELKNFVLCCAARGKTGLVDESLVEAMLEGAPGSASGGPKSLADCERAAIGNALRDCSGNRRAAARRLGISESTLYVKIKRLGFEREGLG